MIDAADEINPFQRTKASHLYSPTGNALLAAQTEMQGTAPSSSEDAMASFTSEGIAPGDQEGDGDLKVRKLNADEVMYLTTEVEACEKECNEFFLGLGMDSRKRPFKIVELCCEQESGLTAAVDARGGVGIRLDVVCSMAVISIRNRAQ